MHQLPAGLSQNAPICSAGFRRTQQWIICRCASAHVIGTRGVTSEALCLASQRLDLPVHRFSPGQGVVCRVTFSSCFSAPRDCAGEERESKRRRWRFRHDIRRRLDMAINVIQESGIRNQVLYWNCYVSNKTKYLKSCANRRAQYLWK